MDALTARKISTMGLNATKPLLPPVHKLGIVHLREPLTDAEEHLHNARLALKNLTEAQEIYKSSEDEDDLEKLKMLKDALYTAMSKLEEKEQYFARRYIFHNKPVLHGWEQTRLTEMIEKLYEQSTYDVTQNYEVNSEFNQDGANAIGLFHIMITTLRDINELCYDADTGARKTELPLPTLKNGQRELVQHLDNMVTLYRKTKQLPDNDPAKNYSFRAVDIHHDAAQKVVRIADNMIRNIFRVP